jgi:hypothetical protein
LEKLGNIELTCGGNPKRLKEEIVCGWSKTGWRNILQAAITNSISRARFHKKIEESYLMRHDVYESFFKEL